MISQKFKEKFKKDLGPAHHYTGGVKAILNKKGILNREGNPYSSDSIRNTFMGVENIQIEAAIMEYYKQQMDAKRKIEEIKKEFSQ